MLDQNRSITFPAIQIKQPIGTFYVGVMHSNDLVEISKADVRMMEDRDLDTYMGIQRRLSASRVKDLQAYVNTYDATFPTAVILAIEGRFASWNSEASTLTLSAHGNEKLEDVAHIIDGQHRVEGLKNYRGPHFEINVSIFVDADIATQANVFATVNLAQTKVNRSLVYDLYDYERSRSPQKSAHHIAVALDRLPESPLHQRIKRLGSATMGRSGETLTQAAVVEALLDFITEDAMKDRDSFLRKIGLERPNLTQLRRRPFRGLFLQEKDSDIAKILLEYFLAVKSKWPVSWSQIDAQGNVLPRTNGFRALMRFLKPTYLSLTGADIGRLVTEDEFMSVLNRVELRDQDFNIETFPPGTGGESKLFNILLSQAFPTLDAQLDLI